MLSVSQSFPDKKESADVHGDVFGKKQLYLFHRLVEKWCFCGVQVITKYLV